MEHKQQATTCLGVWPEGRLLQAVLITTTRTGPQCVAAWQLPLETDQSLVDLLMNTSPLIGDPPPRRVLDQMMVVSAIPSSDLLLRPLSLSLQQDKDITAVLQYEIESLLPYPIDEAVIDWVRGGTDNKIIALAVRHEKLQLHLEAIKNLKPETISCLPVAFAAFGSAALPDKQPTIIIHIGRDQSTCTAVVGNRLINAFAIDNGINSLVEALTKDSNIEYEKAYEQLISKAGESNSKNLISATKGLLQDISRTVYALKKSLNSDNIEKLHFCVTGQGAQVTSLDQQLADKLDFPSFTPNWPFKTLTSVWAAPIGLALSALAGPPVSSVVNFRQGSYTYPHPWRRLWQPLAIYGGLILLISGLITISTAAWSKRETIRLRTDYRSAVAALEYTIDEVEVEFRKKEQLSPLLPDTTESTILKQLDRVDIEARISYLEKNLQGTSGGFPLNPKIPRVSDVLAWLATHPNLSDDNGKPLTTLQNFEYTMLKRPDKTHRREKYQVRVDLEFTAPTPREARIFHDALLESNAFVDPKGDVKWTTSQGKYRATFFLKDKTRYNIGG